MIFYEDSQVTIHNGEALETLRTLSDESINMCVTSPPYWGLRDYGVNGQLGLESTPEEYISKLVEIFREVRRMLKKDGTLWLNLGDSYSSGGRGRNDKNDKFLGNGTGAAMSLGPKKAPVGLKPKELVGIPWRVAFALQADGWWLRQDIIEEVKIYCPNCGWELEERIWRHGQDREIIWKKPNPMPESVTDRCTKAHEYIFLLSKSAKYYYDAEAIKESSTYGPGCGWEDAGHEIAVKTIDVANPAFRAIKSTRNKRSVWTIATKPYPQAHFAVFPPELITPCIKAGCPKDGIVIDPFGGSGTTAEVSKKLGRKCILIELKREYCALAEKRINQQILEL